MPRFLAPLFAFVLIMAGAARAENEATIQNKFINVPSVGAWNVLGAAAQQRDDNGIPGGQSIRIAVPAKGANPWEVQASSGVIKPIKKGDIILVAFWARSEVPAEGQSTAIISSIRFQLTAAPYTSLFDAPASVGPTWKMYYASGAADRDCEVGTVGVSLHLATAKQTIDLGQVIILDFGPDYDRSKLPRNAP